MLFSIFDLERIARNSENVEFEEGEMIFQQGDPGDFVFVIEEGMVEIIRDGEAVKRRGAVESCLRSPLCRNIIH